MVNVKQTLGKRLGSGNTLDTRLSDRGMRFPADRRRCTKRRRSVSGGRGVGVDRQINPHPDPAAELSLRSVPAGPGAMSPPSASGTASAVLAIVR